MICINVCACDNGVNKWFKMSFFNRLNISNFLMQCFLFVLLVVFGHDWQNKCYSWVNEQKHSCANEKNSQAGGTLPHTPTHIPHYLHSYIAQFKVVLASLCWNTYIWLLCLHCHSTIGWSSVHTQIYLRSFSLFKCKKRTWKVGCLFHLSAHN